MHKWELPAGANRPGIAKIMNQENRHLFPKCEFACLRHCSHLVCLPSSGDSAQTMICSHQSEVTLERPKVSCESLSPRRFGGCGHGRPPSLADHPLAKLQHCVFGSCLRCLASQQHVQHASCKCLSPVGTDFSKRTKPRRLATLRGSCCTG